MIKAYKVIFDNNYFRYYEDLDDAYKFAEEKGYIIVNAEECTVREEWVY
ncbi:hypothetical protein [Bacillus sp. FJAT-22090]|nr:hypothetical protein [Bacillus sp. FJAT-22090]